MSPIHRKIKKAAEPTEAESTEAEPIDAEPTAAGRRKWIIAFGLALALGLPAVLVLLSSTPSSKLFPNGPNSGDALFIVILILIVIGSLLRILWRLRNSRKMSVYDLRLRMRFAIVLLVCGLALFAWLNMLREAAVLFIIIVLFLGIYRLRRPDTEKWPNPTFDRRSPWLVGSRRIKRID